MQAGVDVVFAEETHVPVVDSRDTLSRESHIDETRSTRNAVLVLARSNQVRLVALVIAACSAVAVNACSSSEGSGSSSGSSGGSSSGQPENDSGGGGDGSSSGADGSSGTDAPAGDGSSSCDSATSVCDDFDKAATLDAKWSPAASGGTATIVTGGLSAPNALAIVVNAGGGAVYIEKELSFSTKAHCEMDMKIEALPNQGDLDLFSITTKTSTGDYYVYFAHSAAGFVFGEFSEQLPGGGSVDKKQPIAAPAVGAWFHVVLDNDGANATLKVGSATSSLTGLAQPAGTSRNVQVGAPFSQSTEIASRVLYDNVLCTTGN